jgi:hypothetical protein
VRQAKMEPLRGITISVLGYREEDEWVALALEMDLRGFGANFDEALAELVEIIGMQLGFADFKRQPEMVFHPAAPEYFALFAQVREDRLRATLAHQVGEVDSEYDIGGIPIPPAHVIEKQKKKFSLADA